MNVKRPSKAQSGLYRSESGLGCIVISPYTTPRVRPWSQVTFEPSVQYTGYENVPEYSSDSLRLHTCLCMVSCVFLYFSRNMQMCGIRERTTAGRTCTTYHIIPLRTYLTRPPCAQPPLLRVWPNRRPPTHSYSTPRLSEVAQGLLTQPQPTTTPGPWIACCWACFGQSWRKSSGGATSTSLVTTV